jgi:hypothetical protein
MLGNDSNLIISFHNFLSYRSCYNAFSNFNDLDTIAIDIAPADEVKINIFFNSIILLI